jgi:hypothetical protein
VNEQIPPPHLAFPSGQSQQFGYLQMNVERKERIMKERCAWLWIVFLMTASIGGCGSMGGNGGNGTGGGGTSSSALFECYTPGDASNGGGAIGCGVLNSFGDMTADSFFYNEVQNQTAFWNGIPATPLILNDCNGPNAFSLPDGHILYGINLFQLLATAYGEDPAPLSGVLAHEWGHQVQFAGDWMTSNEPTAEPIELEADAFSGYYMALGPDNYPWTSISNYFSAVSSEGDYDFNNPSHHGTPAQRLAAAQLGFQTAVQAAQTNTQFSYSDLHQIFSSQIATFESVSSSVPQVASEKAKIVLSRLDTRIIHGILDGTTRGPDLVIPFTPQLKNLYPKP